MQKRSKIILHIKCCSYEKAKLFKCIIQEVESKRSQNGTAKCWACFGRQRRNSAGGVGETFFSKTKGWKAKRNGKFLLKGFSRLVLLFLSVPGFNDGVGKNFSTPVASNFSHKFSFLHRPKDFGFYFFFDFSDAFP